MSDRMRRISWCFRLWRSPYILIPRHGLGVLVFLFVVSGFRATSFAQEPSESKPDETDVEVLPKPNKTDVEVLAEAETDIQLLLSGQTMRETDLAIGVQRQLESILQRDLTSPLRLRIEQDLTPVHEILGKHNLAIAAFYLSREHGGTRAAEARLLTIVTEYPRFSGMDEVLFRLSTVSLRDDHPEDARAYLWKLVCNHPTSEQIRPAFERLAQIGFGSWEGCDKFKR
jgi:hypothetical protein